MSDAALLALIVDDDDAIHVLAAWVGLDLPVSAADAQSTIDRLAELTTGNPARTRRALDKLRVARVLVDGGITDLADRMLQTRVQQRLHGARRGKR